MTEKHVALLRGINVGGHAKIRMESLRSVFGGLGFTNVETYIQSGNVVFASRSTVKTSVIEAAIASELDLTVTVVVRSRTDLEEIIKSNPFTTVDLSRLHVGFMARSPLLDAVAGLDLEQFRPDGADIAARDLYLHLPAGMGTSKLPNYLARRLKVPVTYRNWNTVTKLLAMASAGPGNV